MTMPNNIPTISSTIITNNNNKSLNKNLNNNNNNETTITIIINKEENEKLKNKKISKKFTCKQKVSLVMLATVEFMSFCSMSIMAPFYPNEAMKKGVSESMAGFIFAFYALIVFLSSPLFGKILPRVGIKFLFISGILTSGICSVIFGTLHQINDYYCFTIFSFLIRGLEALGAGAYTTAGYVIIINIFPDHAGAVRGILETFVGFGMSVGPAIGGFLFAVGGFGLPFYVTGLITILIVPLNMYFLPPMKNELGSKDCSMELKTGSLRKLLKLPTVLMTAILIVVIAMNWSFLDPTLEPHLRQFNLSPENVGLFFLLLSLTYGICSPIFGWATDKVKNYWWLMTIGLFGNAISLSVLGPSTLFPFLNDSLILNIISLAALGVSVAMSLMPTYQSILDSALEGGFNDDLPTNSVIAGLWSSVYSLGEVLGPVLGGSLLEKFGFRLTSTVFAFLNLSMGIISLIYFLSRKKCNKKENDSNEDDVSSSGFYRNRTFDLF